MNPDRLKYLLEQYQIDACTVAELEELNDWFHAHDPGRTALVDWVEEAGGPEALSESFYNDLRSQLHTNSKRTKIIRICRDAATIAASVCALVFCLYPGTNRRPANRSTSDQARASAIPIVPGTNRATLTLSDGSTIALSDSNKGAIAVQSNTRIRQVFGDKITYNATGNDSPQKALVFNTLRTPRGGRFSVTLADGTLVTLDAASSITYPVNFGMTERRVEITGQVFFQVIHQSARPFRVTVKGQTIEDLGTAFNVKAYDDEAAVKITLAEGRVSIANGAKKVTLLPGQQATSDGDRQDFRVKYVNVAETIAWIKGWFVFRHEPVESVMKQAGRWYDVDVIYERGALHKEFGGTLSRYNDISELLENLKKVGGFNYRIEGRKVIFY